jgi:hypothetical protein
MTGGGPQQKRLAGTFNPGITYLSLREREEQSLKQKVDALKVLGKFEGPG